jgi:hypothetical protein
VPCSRNTLRAARVICASVTTRLRATGVFDLPRYAVVRGSLVSAVFSG